MSPVNASDEDDSTAAEDEEIQVVEFSLGEKSYCVSIGEVSELVDMRELTDVPDSAANVEGVMDLRGVTTTVIDPRVDLDVAADGARDRVIVFDDGSGNQGSIGWVVDEVKEVLTVSMDDIDADEQSELVKGLIKQDDEFTIWLDPAQINN